MGKIKKQKFLKMRVIIALVFMIAASSVINQAVVSDKWLCCKVGNNVEPKWGKSCGSRRLQAMAESHCPKKLTAPKRVLQAIVHPIAPNCANFNSRRRLQAVVTYKCPVNIEGVQCFTNDTKAPCKQP